MSKKVACLVVKSSKAYHWLGHMPILNWCTVKLAEVRGIDRIVCVADPKLAPRAKMLLDKEGIEVVSLPPTVTDKTFDAWLTCATGPASDADVVAVVKPNSPFLPSAKIEACLTAVARQKCTHSFPARAVQIVHGSKEVKSSEVVGSLRVFRVNTPVERVSVKTVAVSLLESLDVDSQDEFVMIDALVASDKV